MRNPRYESYRVYLNVGISCAEVEIIVSVWSEEYIEDAVECLYGDRAYVLRYEEIEHLDD